MSKKTKGLSFDQKKETLLKAMLSQASIYNMKELETLGRKNKVIPQAVPEVVEALLSERALCMDKIGTQNIYWAFSSQRKAVLLTTKDKLESEIKAATLRLKEATMKSDKAKKEIKLTENERSLMLNQTAEIKKETEKLIQQRTLLQKKDPQLHEAKLKELLDARHICDKATDNICILRQFLLKKFGHSSIHALDVQFDITPDILEYFVQTSE